MSNDILHQVRAFNHASDLPQEVWDALSRNAAAANVILPFAEKARLPLREEDSQQLWIALFDRSNNVAFVLSCTRGPLDNYPIFIVPCGSTVPPTQEGNGINIADSMSTLVHLLLQKVPPQRVFSVFSTANISRAFARAFEAQAGAEHGIRALYYEAALSSCTKETFVKPDLTFKHREGEDIVVAHRLADESHIEGVQSLCKAFSKTSKPYELDDAGAKLEAETMIKNKQVWVNIVEQAGKEEVACLVATTRESDKVTAVTKVFTAPEWRDRRCASRLLHRVCDHVLSDPKKERVVLYVGTGTSDNMKAARRVYRNIGFQALEEEYIKHMGDEEKWLEIGFENTTLGHW